MSNSSLVKEKIKYPTFEDARILYSSYSTLQSSSVLKDVLLNTIDDSFINAYRTKSIHEIYNTIILKNYPNEITVKSSFINQVLFKSKNHTTIFELPVGSSRADLCKINGESISYEIKTDLDNLSRLDKQLNDYMQIFEKIYVICSSKKLSSIEKHTIPTCGIYTYTISKRGNFRFKLQRAAISINKQNPQKQLSILRKKELINEFSIESLSKRNEIISYILDHYSAKEINNIFKQTLKSRYKKQWEFLRDNKSEICEIDYQWFFKNSIKPQIIYN